MKLPGKKFTVEIAMLVLLFGHGAMANPGHEEPSFHVSQFVNTSNAKDIVLIDAGKDQGVVDGALFNAYRKKAGEGAGTHDVLVETGTLKALDVQPQFTVAKIIEQNRPLASVFFPKFPGVMAGDFIKERPVSIARVQAITPTVSISYNQLFADPNRGPESYELTEEGKARLREAAKPFMNVKLSTLMIEGHTDQNGAADENQIESYQRALTVSQFLASELMFAKDKLRAFGYGETEPAVEDFNPGHRDLNRRIVLKVIP